MKMRRIFYYTTLFMILATLLFLLVKSIVDSEPGQAAEKGFMVGGFSTNSVDKVTNAASDGVQVVFSYVRPPDETGAVGRKLNSLHMKVVDGFIASYLHYYECHRTKTVVPPPAGVDQYCVHDYYPYLNNDNRLLAVIADHLREIRDSQLIMGYWVLDDWPTWDVGSANSVLQKIHKLIKLYTPERPAICGFGATILPGTGYVWNDSRVANFSPQGCDNVGLYIYTPALPNTTQVLSPDVYNWSMTGLLPAIFSSLQQRGWDIKKQPLIGIVQAFGGPLLGVSKYWVTPTAQNIETQSKSFCTFGASGIVFYAWDDQLYGPGSLTPMTSAEIQQGIRNGITACKQIKGII